MNTRSPIPFSPASSISLPVIAAMTWLSSDGSPVWESANLTQMTGQRKSHNIELSLA
ncbi:MAG: hypothetical protein ABR958_05885 [Dehalococcoidales bacterium]